VSAKISVVYSSGRSEKTTRSRADAKVACGRFEWADLFTITEKETDAAGVAVVITRQGYWDGWLGSGNILPFSRILNPLRQPSHLHYEIPASGARTRPMHVCCTNGTCGQA
jgi:hypothetical protein